MGSLSIWHWAVVVGVVVLLFGKNVVSNTMADIGKGIKELRKISHEDDHPTKES